MQSTNPPPGRVPRRPTPGQVLLGVFIVWQLFFLAGFNLLQFRSHTKPPANPDQSTAASAADAVEDFAFDRLGRWGQLTGQTQGWWMFALTLPESTFPLVELRWGQRVETLRSVFDPDDPAAYFHPPGASDRLFHYEMNLTLYNPWKEGKFNPEDAQKAARPAYAYLRWRLGQFQHEHPEVRQPDEVILLRRAYPTPPREARGEPRPRPVDQPLFRWRPGDVVAAGFLCVEPYDPAAHRFVPLKDTP